MAAEASDGNHSNQTNYVSDHASQLLAELDRDRESSQALCDVRISAGKREFLLHKCVMAIFSGIDFKKGSWDHKAKKKGLPVVYINGISPDIMEMMIKFVYKCKITIDRENVYKLIAAAENLKIRGVKEYGEAFLCDIVDSSNCLTIREFANKYKLKKLTEKAEKAFLIENFDMVVSQDDFKHLPLEGVLSLLNLKDEQISQEMVYNAIIAWVVHDRFNRTKEFEKLFEFVDLEKLSSDFLQVSVADEELVLQNSRCLKKLVQTIASRCFVEDVESSLESQDKSPETANFPVASLYVGDLHPDVIEEDLHNELSDVGSVSSLHICRDNITGKSRGFGFVTFDDIDDAKDVLEELNYTQIHSRPIHMTWSQYDPSLGKSGAGCIFVRNLPNHFNNRALFDLFSIFGNILSCRVKRQADDSSCRQGIVHYDTDEAAKLAITTVNDMTIGRKVVSVNDFLTSGERVKNKEIKQEQFTNVFVKNFSNKLNEDDLTKMFEKFGELCNVSVKKDDNGNSLGFGFVNFERHGDAMQAIEALDGIRVKNTKAKLYVGRAMKKQERQETLKGYHGNEDEAPMRNNLYVKNFDDTLTDEELEDLFSPFGEITSAKIMRDAKGNSRKFGFVCFKTEADAATAKVKMHQKKIKGKSSLYVNFHEKKDKTNEVPTSSGVSLHPCPVAVTPLPLCLVPHPMLGPNHLPMTLFHMRPFPPGPMPMRGNNEWNLASIEEALKSQDPKSQKETFRNIFFPHIAHIHGPHAPQVMKALLEEDNSILLEMLKSEDAFKEKVNEIAKEMNSAILSKREDPCSSTSNKRQKKSSRK